jgi:hypothetical protein
MRSVRAEDDLSFIKGGAINFMATDLYFKDLAWYMMAEKDVPPKQSIKLAIRLASSFTALSLLALSIF